MSHAATKWAFDQPELHRDMKPSEWAVLMVLADCHNPVNGCFPSQDYICSKTNLAERAVRDQLSRLRERGLIDWDAARENGKRGANRYSLAFEPGFLPAKSAGSSTGENGQEQPAKSDSFNRQNLPPNLVREPVKEPERERTQADGDDTTEAPEGHSKRAERLFYAAFKSWDRFDVSPKQPMLAAWVRLTWPQMEAAADAVPRFLAKCRADGVKQACAVSTYLDLAERMWERFPPEPVKPEGPIAAAPFGKLWQAARFKQFVTGPKAALPALTAVQLRWIEAGTVDEAQLRLERQAASGWPAVNAMHDRAANHGKGVEVSATLKPLAEGMEAVKVGTDLWRDWQAEHARRGWPWLPDPGRLEWVWFPAGGPGGLADFERAVRGLDHDGKPQTD